MKDDRLFECKKADMLLLLNMGMPYAVLHRMLNISASTVINYFSKLRKSRQWKKKIVPLDEAKPELLKCYAYAKQGTFPLSWRAKDDVFKAKFTTILAEILEEEKIIQMLDSFLPVVYSFSRVKYAADVPSGYIDLIDNFFSLEDVSSAMIWKEYLIEISLSIRPLPTLKQFVWGKSHFVYDIISSCADEARNHIAPIVTARVCGLIDGMLHVLLPREREVLVASFGLHDEKQSLDLFSQKWEILLPRVKQIKMAAILKLKRELQNDVKWISTSCEEMLLLKEQHQQELFHLRMLKDDQIASLNQKVMALEHPESVVNISEDNPNLLLHIDDLRLSAKTYKCLRSSDVEYVWQLVQWTPVTLFKIYSFGKKSLVAVVERLTAKNLFLGMEFTPYQIATFESKTIKKISV